MVLVETGGCIGAFIGGAASTYFFHKPLLNQAGIRILVSGGLQETALAVASFCMSFMNGLCAYGLGGFNGSPYVPSQWSQEKINRYAIFTFVYTYALCCVATVLAAATLTNRLGTPTEALINFAVSSVLGYLCI